MSAYFKHWDCYVFDTVVYINKITLELVSSLFQVKVVVHSVFESNQAMFTSTLNNEYVRQCTLVSIAEKDHIGYASAVLVSEKEDLAEETEFNRQVLLKLSEKYKVVNLAK